MTQVQKQVGRGMFSDIATLTVKNDLTYAFEGKILTQAEMLQVKASDGEPRFRLMCDERGRLSGWPEATLADRTNPLYPIKSEQALAAEFARRRKAEGHFRGRHVPKAVDRSRTWIHAEV